MPAIKTTACPEIVELECLAAGGAVADFVRAHVTECEACRSQLASITDNNSLIYELASASHAGFERPPPRAVMDAIPGYAILSIIRSGGQGVVYRAEQLKTKRVVALKVLLGGALATARQRARFEREVELVAALRHPNIVTLFDSGTTSDGHPYYAMEFVDGIPLDDFCAWHRSGSGPHIPVAQVIHLFGSICDAVHYAHQRGIVHRDLKPANILIDSSSQPRILDFGLAKVTGEDHLATAMTFTGEFMGTFAYASPEQAAGLPDQIDIRTDVYSLGVIFYEMLTGQMPYPVGGSMGSVVRNITEIQPQPPSVVRSALGDEIDTIVLKALAKEPERRYQSAGELLRDLKHYLAGEPIDAKRDSTWYLIRKTARRHRLAVLLAGVSFLFVSAVAVMMTVQAQRLAVERDESKREKNRAEGALEESSIERARLVNASDNVSMAERLVWPIFLRSSSTPVHSKQSGELHHLPTDPAYWALWEIYFRSPCLATWQGPLCIVRSIVFDKDGRTALICFDNETVWRWDTGTGRALMVFSRPSGPSDDCCYLSDDGQDLIVITKEGTEIWALEPGHPMRFMLESPFRGAYPITCKDSRLLAYHNVHGALVVYDLNTGQKLSEHPPGPGVYESASFADHGKLLIMCYRNGCIRVRNSRTAALIAERTIILESQIARLLAGTGRHDRVVARFGGRIRVLSLPSLAELARLEGHQYHVTRAAFSPDARRLASISADLTLRLWNLNDYAPIATYFGHESCPQSVAWSPDGTRILAGNSTGVVRMWNAQPNGAGFGFVDPHVSQHSICYSPDGRVFATGGADTQDPDGNKVPITIWDARKKTKLQALTGHASGVTSIALSADGDRLVSTGRDNTLRIWSVADAREIASITLPDYGINKHGRSVFTPDGQHIIVGCFDGRLRVFDVANGEPTATIDAHRGRIASVDVCPDGKQFISASADQTFAVWDLGSLKLIRRTEVPSERLRVVRYNHKGNVFATGGDDSKVRIWDARTGECLWVLERHRQLVFSLAFSPDDRLIASGDNTGMIHLWDVEAGRNLMTLAAGSGDYQVFSLAFSPDGRTLAAACGIGGIKSWDLTHFDRHIEGNRDYWTKRITE